MQEKCSNPGYTLAVPFHMLSFLSDIKHMFSLSPYASLNCSKNQVYNASFSEFTMA